MDDLTRELRRIARSISWDSEDGISEADRRAEKSEAEEAEDLKAAKSEAMKSLDSAVRFIEQQLPEEHLSEAQVEAASEVVEDAISKHGVKALERLHLHLVSLFGKEDAVDKVIYASEKPGVTAEDVLGILNKMLHENEISASDLKGHHEAGNIMSLIKEEIDRGEFSPADLFMTDKALDVSQRKEVARLCIAGDVEKALDHTHVVDVLSDSELHAAIDELDESDKVKALEKLDHMRA